MLARIKFFGQKNDKKNGGFTLKYRANMVVWLGAMLLLSSCAQVEEFWHQINEKSKNIQEVKDRHTVLLQEYKKLKTAHLELEYRYQTLQAKWVTKKNRDLYTTRSNGKNCVKSDFPKEIEYLSSSSISSEELFNLAIRHSKSKRFRDALVLMEKILTSDDQNEFQTVENFFQGGVIAYKANDYKLAKKFFQKVNEMGDSYANHNILKRTQLWLKTLDRIHR